VAVCLLVFFVLLAVAVAEWTAPAAAVALVARGAVLVKLVGLVL
jgi:hypothetical protein